MVMNSLRQGAAGGVLKFFLFGLLVLAVGGLVLMDVGGFFRGGLANGSVAKVGGEEMTIAEFDRIARRAVARYGMSTQDAYQMGLIDQILGAEIRGRVLQEIAGNMGLKVSEERVTQQIKNMLSPIAAQQNMSPADAFQQILYNQGMSERYFISSVQRELESSAFSSALQSGFAALPETVIRDIYNVQNETRDVTYIPYMDDEVKDTKQPEDSQLEALYDAMKEQRFAKPELRSFQVLKIDMDSLRDTIEITEDQMLGFYQIHLDAYTTPASHTLEQALLLKEEDAKATLQEFNAGKSLSDAVQSATGSKTAYLGEKDVTPETMVEELKEEVLKVEAPGTLVGPVKTPLGWSIAVVKKINPEHLKDFADVRDEIKAQIEETQLVEQMYELADMVDDQFAGGASVEDVSQQVKLQITSLPPISQAGLTADQKDAFSEKDNYRDAVLKNGFDLAEGETSPVIETSDGGFIAVHLQSITPKSYTPFEDVKAEIRDSWIKDQRRMDNMLTARQTIKAMEDEGQTLQELAATKAKTPRTLSGISRDGALKKPLTARSVQNLFSARVGEPLLIDIDGGVAIAVVTAYHWPETAKEDELKAVRDSQLQNLKNEALATYLQSKQDEYNVMINRALLTQAYGQSADDTAY